MHSRRNETDRLHNHPFRRRDQRIVTIYIYTCIQARRKRFFACCLNIRPVQPPRLLHTRSRHVGTDVAAQLIAPVTLPSVAMETGAINCSATSLYNMANLANVRYTVPTAILKEGVTR